MFHIKVAKLVQVITKVTILPVLTGRSDSEGLVGSTHKQQWRPAVANIAGSTARVFVVTPVMGSSGSLGHISTRHVG